uniref:(California timema) hypothetical protein n=1 Tax=Timema californicum TaxID=61474 RepID=A0A7R9JJK3_TIMCA|nr:unnamed protein product [Timema californicum]
MDIGAAPAQSTVACCCGWECSVRSWLNWGRHPCIGIYSSDPDIFRSHTTWHCQLDNNVLLVAHGTGQVGVVDLRDSKKPTRWCKCHDRSVRTVQRHPLDERYFVTSSAVGEARVWE